MTQKPNNLYDVLKIISQQLTSTNYAIRGTSSLVLQGLDFNVSDIDIVCTKDTALNANTLLKKYLVVPVEYKETEKFKSYFGKFLIENVEVEIMGDWQIKNSKGAWSLPFDGSTNIKLNLNGFEIFVTTLESELSMFSYMQRWPVYHKIKRHLQGLKNVVSTDSSNQIGLFS